MKNTWQTNNPKAKKTPCHSLSTTQKFSLFTAQADPLGTIIHTPNTIGKGQQGVVENNARDTIWDAWPAHQDRCCKYLEAQQIFLWFYIPNFQRLCLSLLLLISSLLHDYSSLFLFLALHFVVYLMDGRLIMGTGM